MQAARLAATKIEVDYEVLAPLTDPFEALRPDAPQLHPAGNVLDSTIIKRGDLQAAQRASAFISSDRYQTQRIEHGYMEPEAAIAYPEEDGLTVFSQSQGV